MFCVSVTVSVCLCVHCCVCPSCKDAGALTIIYFQAYPVQIYAAHLKLLSLHFVCSCVHVRLRVRVCVFVYACTYVCVYIYIYIYIYMFVLKNM